MSAFEQDSSQASDVKPDVVEKPEASSPNKPAAKKSRSPKKEGSPRKSPSKPTPKESIIGQAGKPDVVSEIKVVPGRIYKTSDVEVVMALFERVVAKGSAEDADAVAEQFGIDKRLLKMSWRNTFRKKRLKIIRDGWS